MEDVQLLRNEIAQYTFVDNQIKNMNRDLSAAREQRTLIEDRLSVILSTPQFVGYERLSVNSDNSMIKIRRPQQWDKPWSLSRSGLRELLIEYFRDEPNPTAIGCFDYIVLRNSKKSVTFAFERIVSE